MSKADLTAWYAACLIAIHATSGQIIAQALVLSEHAGSGGLRRNAEEVGEIFKQNQLLIQSFIGRLDSWPPTFAEAGSVNMACPGNPALEVIYAQNSVKMLTLCRMAKILPTLAFCGSSIDEAAGLAACLGLDDQAVDLEWMRDECAAYSYTLQRFARELRMRVLDSR